MSSEKIKFKYFYGKEADMLTFYRIPKLLITDDYFKELSSDAKILYGLMLDRMSISAKNDWMDEENRVFIFFSMEDTMEYLHVGKNKALGLLAALDSDTGIGLIERVKQGQGKPARIYVKSFMRDEMQGKMIDQKFENQTSEEKERVSDVYKLNVKRFENQTSRGLEIGSQDVSKSNPSKNKYTNTDFSNTESNPIISEDEVIRSDADAYAELIRENLDLDILISRDPINTELYESIYELVLETVLIQNDYVVIASNKYPINLVKSKFLKLDSGHVGYVIDCMKGNTTRVRNIKKYLLAALFNAPTTINSYYQAEVNFDFPQYATR